MDESQRLSVKFKFMKRSNNLMFKIKRKGKEKKTGRTREENALILSAK